MPIVATYTNKLVTPPATEPVTLPEIKRQLDIPTAELGFDTKLTRLGKAARNYVERATSRAFVSQVWLRGLDAFPLSCKIELPTNPVISLDAFNYYDTDGNQQLWAAGNYRLNNSREPAIVEIVETPPGTEVRLDALELTYTTGYSSTDADGYEILREALLMLVDHWFNDPSGSMDVPPHVKTFLVNSGFGDEFAQY